METITLRGHHLRILYQHYVWKTSLEVIRAKLSNKYNEKQAVKVVKILSDIVKGNAQITFIDGLDDICLGCPRYDSTCENTFFNSADDKRYIKKLGLNVGIQYPAEDILKRLEEKDASIARLII